MIDIKSSIILLLSILTCICIVGYLVSPDKKFLKVLENKIPKGAHSINLIGTVMYGSKLLTKEQLKHYGLEISSWHKKYYEEYGPYLKGLPLSMRKFFPQIQTTFISFIFPLIPLRSQIVFNIEEDKSDPDFKKKFNAIPIELYWKQAFFILSLSYGSLLAIAFIAFSFL